MTGKGDDGGVPHGKVLKGFAEALIENDEAALEASRKKLHEILGPEALVDSAAVAANFNMMDRIADSTGIPLDGMMEISTAAMRREIGVGGFAAAENTPEPGLLKHLLSRVMEPLAPKGMRIMQALQGKRKPS